MKYYPVAKPNLGRKEEQYVVETLRSGVLSLGAKAQLLEKNFAKMMGTRYACVVSSGTAGLHLALLAAGLRPGDEVITTPFSFVASANAILYVGAKPIFVDIDPVTYNMDPASIPRLLTKKTRAILVVHIFGQPADMRPIMNIARRHNLKVIEDACESIGAKYRGRKVGTFGDAGIFSFYPNKQITTGEGGMIVTNKSKIYHLCRSLRNQGRNEDMRWLAHKRLGYNYRMTEMSAALGVVQLRKLIDIIRERQKISRWYTKHFRAHDHLIHLPAVGKNRTHTWFVYTIRLKNRRINRDKIIEVLSKEGIATKPYLPSIHLFDFYKARFGYKKGDFPVSEEVSRSSLALPFYNGLREHDIKYIASKVIKAITHYDK